MKIKCETCNKRRETATHYDYILTPDGQDIQEYDFAQLCVECSRDAKRHFGWKLSSEYEIKGRRFIKIKQ